MDEDEIAAVHEAAHAVFAAFSPGTRIHGPVTLTQDGGGDIRMATDVRAFRKTIMATHRLDWNLPRLHLVRSLLAGPVAERILVERGRARLTEAALVEASAGDYANVLEQLARLSPPRPDLLVPLEGDVREELERPAVWSTVERFAGVLLRRRCIEAGEASAILRKIGTDQGLLPPKAAVAREGLLPAVVAAVATTGWIWARTDAHMLAGLISGVVAGAFALGLAWRLGGPQAPLTSRLLTRKAH